MFTVTKKSIEWAGKTLELETGRIARQATGAVLVTYGGTKVLCTAVAQKEAKAGIDFFPLTVVYQEKTYSAGIFPGGFIKRENRPSEHEILTSRLIDRPIRPLFNEHFKNETQVICTVIQYDKETPADIPAMIGASAALSISGLPFNGPIAGARVAHIDGELVVNPDTGFEDETELDLIVAGTESSVMMVESEVAELPEDVMLSAVKLAHESCQPVIELINELAKEAGKDAWEVQAPDYGDLPEQVKKHAEKALIAGYKEQDKQARTALVNAAKSEALNAIVEADETVDTGLVKELLKKLEKDIVRGDLFKTKKRIDGRKPDEIRQIVAEVGVLPLTHGSALFTRGETQSLVVTTLGTGDDEQRGNSLDGEISSDFLLHYNFPPYSVGEAFPLRAPGRREIGHGKLAWRALNAVVPPKEDFPYTIRLVSDITESNGSSSMATVCGSSLAMMDAGVPISEGVSGIAMGLVKEGDEFVVLSDIMGDEDHLGDMDFKVAGTPNGITSLQMDIKIQGITIEIMEKALDQAKAGRAHILGEMEKAIKSAREEVNDSAPKIVTIQIPVDKIREVIGSGGKVIREITETTGAKIDIEEDGTINVAAVDGHAGKAAVKWIEDIVAEPEVGEIYHECEVVNIVDFGAFVRFMGKSEGLVHISEIEDRRLDNVEEVLSLGDKVKVKLLDIDRQGRNKLSMRVVNQETGEDISDQVEQREPKPKREGGKDKGDRKPRRKAS